MPAIQPDLHWAIKYLKPLVIKKIKNDAIAHGMGRHSRSEVIDMGCQDLRGLASFLGKCPYLTVIGWSIKMSAGNKKFFMGDEPTEVDCSLFGQLAQLLWNSPGSPFESVINGIFFI